MLAPVIQRQVPIGSHITVLCKDGNESTGILREIGRDHISIEHNYGLTTILLEMVSGWNVPEDTHSKFEQSSESRIEVVNNSKIANTQQIARVSTETVNSSNLKILEKVLEIEARFRAQLQTAKLKMIPPNFAIARKEFSGHQTQDAAVVWERVKNQYEYALKMNELSSKFGRVQPIIRDLEALKQRFPTSPSINRQLAYLHVLSGNTHQAVRSYQEAATVSQTKDDWHNVAAVALMDNSEGLACYGLEQYFRNNLAIDHLDAWYVYIRLLHKFSNYSALSAYFQIPARAHSHPDEYLLLETGIYLLKITAQDQIANDLVQKWLTGKEPKELAIEAFKHFSNHPSEQYRQIVETVRIKVEEQIGQEPNFSSRKPEDSKPRKPVVKDQKNATKSKKSPIASRISSHRTTSEMFEFALRYANDGDYSRAIAQVRKILDIDPKFSQARIYHEKWRGYARATGVPRGANPFARAKRVQLLEKDLERAAQIFEIAIKEGDNAESAVKDRAAILHQLGRTQEAIHFLQKSRSSIKNKMSVDNILIGLYQNEGQYNQAIRLLRNRLKRENRVDRKVETIRQIAWCHVNQGDFVQAEQTLGKALGLRPEDIVTRRQLAICLLKQEKFDDAKKILNNILDIFSDVQSAELLEIIKQSEATGQTDQIILETSLSKFYTTADRSEFVQFFLERCDFQGVPSAHVQEKRFTSSDIRNLEALASKLGTRRPRERSSYYLSAARIITDLEDENLEDENHHQSRFHRYLCRSLASMGDAAVIEDRWLDTAQAAYVEALAVYDRVGIGRGSSDDQDAVNALVRYLYATMGTSSISIDPDIPTIDETIEEVLQQHPQQKKVFESVTYLISRSRWAAQRILGRLYEQPALRAMALKFLKEKGVSIQEPIGKLDSFVELWDEVRRKSVEQFRAVSEDFRFLRQFDFTTAILEKSIEQTSLLSQSLFFELDRQRTRQLQSILSMALGQCKQDAFEERERLCFQINSHCDRMLEDIEDNPTKIAVEEIYPVVQIIRDKVNEYLETLYIDSMPRLDLRLPIESYMPDSNRQFEVQISVTNGQSCSPAEALELIFEEDGFVLNKPEIKLDGSLRGGDTQILRVPMQVSEKALHSQAFSLPVFAQYRTRTEDVRSTSVQNFSIRLHSGDEFKRIDNPYATYAEGGIVDAPEMFYGREDLVENFAKIIQDPRTQSKSIVIYGQKRSGKSSILHHLKRKLQDCPDLLIVDLGNIGSILDEDSKTPFSYHILWSILNRLEYAIEDKEEITGSGTLDFHFSSAQDFYSHPSPFNLFRSEFDQYKRQAARLKEWRNMRVVLLIDEFSYIYEQIVRGLIPESFMKSWKALLQENYFSVVLVGQDVMPKFKQRFPNEFGTTQDTRVTYLREEEAKKLIDEPIRIEGHHEGQQRNDSRYRERAIERILDLTAGNPFYIQIVCNRLVEYMNRKHASLVTASDVEQVKDELVRDVNALGQDKFDNLINSGDTSESAISDEDILNVLTTIAANSQTGSCNRHSIDCKTLSSIETILQDLMHREVIEREGAQSYRIRVGLFKEWLVAHAG